MAAKLDQSKPSALPPNISIFGAKAGFLIPKNKLPGSFVARSNAKNEAPASSAASSKEHNINSQRNTKWGPDLTLDPAVRKSRASAYQTRLDQITKELKSGSLEISENEDSMSTARVSNSQGANNQKENVQGKVELLELERREIIGEILHLNPGYKVPEDYKPLLKETKIPLPTKAHPGHNIIGILMGPESNAQKRLQEDTGAKIRVYGIKRSNGEKSEIRQPDIDEAQDAYEDLYINVSADSYDKVDAAIALIELLLTPVSVNSTSVEANATISSAVSSGGADLSDLWQVQNNSSQPGFLQYQSHNAHWLFTPQANVPPIPSSGPLQSALPNNSLQLQPPGGSLTLSMPSYTGPPPLMNTMPRNPLPIPGPQPSMPNTQQPPLQFQPNPSVGPLFGRPPGVVDPQLMPSSTLPRPVRPLQTPHAHGGWPTFSSVPVQPQRPSPTFMPVRPPISVSPLVSSPQLEGAVPSFPCQSNISTSYGTQHPSGASFAPSATKPSIPPGGPQSFPSVSPQGPSSTPMLSSPAGLTPQPPYPLPMQMHPPMATPAQMRGPSSFPQAGPTPGMPQVAPSSSHPPAGFGMPGSGSMPAMRPPRASTGDFTFWPLVLPSPTLELRASGSQMPLFHPGNQRPPMVPVEGFQRPLDMGHQPRVYAPAPPAPHPHFGGGSFLPRNPAASALQSPRTGGFVGGFPHRPPAVEAQRPFHVLPPPQQKAAFAETSSGRQGPPIYDPFVPSAVLSGGGGGGKGKAEEDKAEYEDLMASVGVK